MRIGFIIVVSISLWSCQSRNTPAIAEAASDTKANHRTDVIVLDQTAQQKGHIVVENVRARIVAESLNAPGQLTVSEEGTWRVGAIAAGRVQDLAVQVGDMVRTGQVLGHLHSHELHEARGGYQEASVELERAQKAEAYAKQVYSRALRLRELKAGSVQDVETAEMQLRNAQALIDRAETQVAKERAHLEIFRVPTDDEGDADLTGNDHDDIPIFAPAAGMILERRVTVGSVANAGDQLFTITDTSTLWMIAAASEEDLSKLTPGLSVRIQVRAYPDREFSGRVLRLGEQLDRATRTLQVRILVPNPQGLLKPEMYATAVLEQPGRRPVLLLPDEAIQDINGVPAVFVQLSQNQFEARTVKSGRRVNGETEILEGITAGDVVVVKGSFLLKSEMLRSTIQEN